LIFVSCCSCGATLGWCSEEDYAVGVYNGTELRELGLGESRTWARDSCPICKSGEMAYSSAGEVERLGFTAAEINSS
jgi:hypothetical protein